MKMGRWALLPADTETWMMEETSRAFEVVFGLPKGILNICTLEDGFVQNYVPNSYAEALMRQVEVKTATDPKWLERALRTFYSAREEARAQLRTCDSLESLSVEELMKLYRHNRSWVHRISAYDQFGWITESYWEPKLHAALKRAGLEEGAADFHATLFALTKPEVPSTTVLERLAVLQKAQSVLKDSSSLEDASRELAQTFGWMPVFTFGTPWTQEHYVKLLEGEMRRDEEARKKMIVKLEGYTEQRNREWKEILQRLNWADADAQVFLDFGLMLDARNEAEFFVSEAGYNLLPLYLEIARRLELDVTELRKLYEEEIVAALEGRLEPKACLVAKQGIIAYGYDAEMKTRVDLTGSDARELFEAVEKNAAQASSSVQSKKGICASSGKARGRARLLNSPKDNDRVEEGDILITVATTVDYLPSMQRAAAIVTEVGGLTCHAAVVCRELEIPCIVSYKNAMTLFQDGEWLDLNADMATITRTR